MPETIIDAGDIKLRHVPNWPDLSEGLDLVEVAGVAIDSKDRVYVFRALYQLPLVAEQVFKKVVVPLRRRRGPCALQPAADRINS